MATIKKKTVAGNKRGPKIKDDKKRPVQVYLPESEIMAIGKYLNPKAKGYNQCVAEVRGHVIGFLEDHAALRGK